MTPVIDDYLDDIDQLTIFSEVRDLAGKWSACASHGLPTLAAFAAELAGPVGRRAMLLAPEGERLRYVRVGSEVVVLFGHDPTGRLTGDINNGHARAFACRYLDAIASERPLFCVERRSSGSTLSTSERLLLPLDAGDGKRQLLVYVRAREDSGELLRAVFNTSRDSIFAFAAVRDADNRIVDGRIVVANSRAAAGVGREPDGIIGAMLLEIAPHLRESGIWDRYVAAIERQQAEVFEAELRSPAQPPAQFQISVVPLGDGLAVTATDTGELRQALEAIERQRNDLVAANRELERRSAELSALADSLATTTRDLRIEVERRRSLEAELTRLAETDPLTGASNRRAFFRELEQAVSGQGRGAWPVALVAIDLDHFKPINDRHGHPAGDAVLAAIGRTLKAMLRPGVDRLGRLGGEEFAVMMPGLDIHEAATRAEAIRKAVEATQPVYQGTEIRVTASLGVAVSEIGASSSRLVSTADGALYRAKNKGRNCIAVARPSQRQRLARSA